MRKRNKPALNTDNIKDSIEGLSVGDFIEVPTGKTSNCGNKGTSTALPKRRAEVVGITDRLIIVRLPNGILDSITIKEYAIERIEK